MTQPLETYDESLSTNNARSENVRDFPFEIDSSNRRENPHNEFSIQALGPSSNSDTDKSLTTDTSATETGMREITKEEIGKTIGGRQGQHLSFPSSNIHRETFISLQKWEGTVIELTQDTIVTRLVDITSNEPDEIAELSIEDVQDDEMHLLEPGAVFILSIGYKTSQSGQRSRQTLLLFRDLPVWRQAGIETARKKAAELRRSIDSGAE